MSFTTTAQIGEILLLRNIGLRHHHTLSTAGMHQQITQHFHESMNLWPMNAGCVRLLPDKANRIKSNPANAMGELLLQQTGEAEQHFRTAPIQVDLIRTKCGPHLAATIRALQGCEQC